MVKNLHPRPLLRHQLIHRPLRRPSPSTSSPPTFLTP
ncbi:hypothetical protein LINPERPRIM_LOCUS20394 [Linum perenne]